MNKKYLVSSLLMVLLSVSQSFSMYSRLFQHAIGSTLVGATAYVSGKLIAQYKEQSFSDAPQSIQRWARPILAEGGMKNADSVPLKIDDGWAVYRGSLITIDRKQVDLLENCLGKKNLNASEQMFINDAEETLRHEKKHYQNGDYGKGLLLYALTAPLILESITLPGIILKLGMIAGTNLAYTRYQEAEADRSAFMNMPSLEKLEMVKAAREQQVKLFENNMRNYYWYHNSNWLAKKVGPAISDQFNVLDEEAWNASDDFELAKIEQKQAVLIAVADFIWDHKHPSFKRQLAIAQECIEARKTPKKEVHLQTSFCVI